MTTVLAYVPDLMDRSRFPTSLGVTFVATPEDLVAHGPGAEIAVADLGRTGAFEALQHCTAARRIGFAGHVDAEALRRASADGIEAMARSRFFSRISQLLSNSEA